MKVTDSLSAYVHPTENEVDRLLQTSSAGSIQGLSRTGRYGWSARDKVDISPMGRLIAQLHAALIRMEDTEGRNLALRGLDCVLRDLFHRPGSAPMLAWMNAALRFLREDDTFFCTLFKTFGTLVAGGYDWGDWVGVGSGIKNPAAFRTFVEETSDLIETGDEIAPSSRETFRFFLSIWKTRLSSPARNPSSEKRKYLRKRMRLAGYYHRLPTLLRSEIVIKDLSPGGFSFEVLGEHPPRTDELIQVFFVLDDYVRKGIQRLAVVRRWDGREGGAQFCA